MRTLSDEYDCMSEQWNRDTEPHALVRAYQHAYEDFFCEPAPDVRVSEGGGFYIREPVGKQYTTSEIRRITRMYHRVVQ